MSELIEHRRWRGGAWRASSNKPVRRNLPIFDRRSSQSNAVRGPKCICHLPSGHLCRYGSSGWCPGCWECHDPAPVSTYPVRPLGVFKTGCYTCFPISVACACGSGLAMEQGKATYPLNAGLQSYLGLDGRLIYWLTLPVLSQSKNLHHLAKTSRSNLVISTSTGNYVAGTSAPTPRLSVFTVPK